MRERGFRFFFSSQFFPPLSVKQKKRKRGSRGPSPSGIQSAKAREKGTKEQGKREGKKEWKKTKTEKKNAPRTSRLVAAAVCHVAPAPHLPPATTTGIGSRYLLFVFGFLRFGRSREKAVRERGGERERVPRDTKEEALFLNFEVISFVSHPIYAWSLSTEPRA